MTGSISALDNMSMQLYGTPYTPAFGIMFLPPDSLYSYPQNQTSPQGAGNSVYNAYNQQGMGQQTADVAQSMALTEAESQALVETYQKGMEPADKLALSGAITMAITQNPRIIAHPWNTIQTFFGVKNGGATNKMFEGLRDSKLWKDHAYVMEEAFAQMNRTEARSMTKLGWFRKQYSPEEYKQLKEIMESAIKSGDVDKIAEATETLRHAQVNDGWIPGLWHKIRGKDKPTVASKLADKSAIKTAATGLAQCKDMTFGQAWNRAGGTWGLMFGGLELIGSVGKIKTAFQADSTTGFKQLGQSVVKAAANTVGWQAGEALGIWGATKITPAITKALGPKWGTIVAALAPPISALAASWASRKVAKAVVGEDVANKVQAEQAATTQEGQIAMVQDLAMRAQKGEQIDPLAMQAAQKIAMQYGAIA